MKAIETEKLTKFYGKSRGITNVDLSVEQGDFFGFIGPNGAGKSTAIRTLLGLISPTSGTVKLFGKYVSKRRTDLLDDVGYLPSETMFYRGMTVRDTLKLSADLHRKDCSEESKKLCDCLELDVTRKVDELSLGNRKKVGIVCALQHKPKLYVLDEPTSGLDPLMQKTFYTLLKERNEKGATVFLSSHVLSEVQRYCKHAAIIREGEILVTDSVSNLGHTGAKRVTIRGLCDAPDLAQIKDVKVTPDSLSFLYSGKPDALLKTLAAMPIEDITIAEPDLEEIFLHYYKKDGADRDNI